MHTPSLDGTGEHAILTQFIPSYPSPVYQGQVTSKSFENPPSTVHIISGYAGSRESFNGFSDDATEPWSVWRQVCLPALCLPTLLLSRC
jgi:hypothetical protein